MAGPITIANVNSAGVARLVNVILAALNNSAISGSNPWPFDPDSLDFTSGNVVTITVDGLSATARVSFATPGSPTLSGTVDLTKLSDQLVTAPNTFSNDSGAMGPLTTLRWDSPTVTRQRSGKFFVTAEWDGTQSLQTVVTATLYRDYGLAGQTLVHSWSIAPGGLGGFNFTGHRHAIDEITDDLPHTYTSFVTGTGGSQLSVGAGGADFDIFELGPPS